jgi:hypothetical protein
MRCPRCGYGVEEEEPGKATGLSLWEQFLLIAYAVCSAAVLLVGLYTIFNWLIRG